jgi:class 3 adenylate cyclase
MMKTSFKSLVFAAFLIGAFFSGTSLRAASDDDTVVAKSLADMLRAARQVISNNQARINDLCAPRWMRSWKRPMPIRQRSTPTELASRLLSRRFLLALSTRRSKIEQGMRRTLPEQTPHHATAVAHMALGMLEIVHETGKRFGEKLEVRIGIHSGEVVAGLIGRHRSIYDVWGDTVNTASRLESSGLPNRIQISDSTYNKVKDTFACELRGPVEIKGKGMMLTYFLGSRLA